MCTVLATPPKSTSCDPHPKISEPGGGCLEPREPLGTPWGRTAPRAVFLWAGRGGQGPHALRSPHCGAVPIAVPSPSPSLCSGVCHPQAAPGSPPFPPPHVPTTPKLWGEPFPIPNPLCPRSTAVGIGFYGNSETNDGVYQLLYALDNANHTLTGIDALVGSVGQGPPTPFEPPRGAALPSRSSSPPFFFGEKKALGNPERGRWSRCGVGGLQGTPPQPYSSPRPSAGG